MPGASPLPTVGEVFFDARGEERALRLSRHQGSGVVILSMWKSGVCTATFRLPDTELPTFQAALSELMWPAAEPGRSGSAASDRRVFPVTDEHPRLPPPP